MSLTRSQHLLPAGRAVPCPWGDAFAVVTEGSVEVRTPHGGRLLLVRGDVVCLARIGPALLTALGPVDAVVTAVRRDGDPGEGR